MRDGANGTGPKDAQALRLGLIADLHWTQDRPPSASWHNPFDFEGLGERVAEAMEAIRRAEVDFVVAAGDVAHLGDLESQLGALLAIGRRTDRPLIAVSGNHDASGSSAPLKKAVDLARRTVAPERLADITVASAVGARHGDVRLAGLQVARTDGWFGAHAEERPAVEAWGRELVVLVSHYPLVSRPSDLTARGFAHPAELTDGTEHAAALVGRSDPTLILSGHLHARASYTEGPVLQLIQGALVEAPFEFSVIELETDQAGQLTVSRHSRSLHDDGSTRLPVFAADEESWTFLDGAWIPSRGDGTRTFEANTGTARGMAS